MCLNIGSEDTDSVCCTRDRPDTRPHTAVDACTQVLADVDLQQLQVCGRPNFRS